MRNQFGKRRATDAVATLRLRSEGADVLSVDRADCFFSFASDALLLEITLRLRRKVIRLYISEHGDRSAFAVDVSQQNPVPRTPVADAAEAFSLMRRRTRRFPCLPRLPKLSFPRGTRPAGVVFPHRICRVGTDLTNFSGENVTLSVSRPSSRRMSRGISQVPPSPRSARTCRSHALKGSCGGPFFFGAASAGEATMHAHASTTIRKWARAHALPIWP
jgi:hypothetical protein